MSVGAELSRDQKTEPLDLDDLELAVRRGPDDDWETFPVGPHPNGLIGLGPFAVKQVSGGEAIVASDPGEGPGQENIIYVEDKTVSIINGPDGIEAHRLLADEADDSPGSLELFKFE